MDTSTASASALLELDAPVCPYAGLRTFTEDEGIYFRGREGHVARCLELLVAQHFVMITGASGDGKSSLVQAGMLPEVQAGFVRARHSRWRVATFRPERSPLRNLAQALATALRRPEAEELAEALRQPEVQALPEAERPPEARRLVEAEHLAHSTIVETELERGFSALVRLYQNSALCPPAAPPEGLMPAEARQQQRRAANLLLVVDQFEEFFTNPENYDGDQPNTAAQTVVNLLLETTRLAQAEGLPIYIVCTMRSDFVGQCAEFRGLIEQVGASQYFVPRLLRHEFLQVIKEPAALSGNRISERLAQRLLYDIGQGQDQLPVLQHALRRIWLAADEGREEMDLIHYAMVGGLRDELPPEDRARFAAWRAALPAHQQQFLLANAGLRNVLDAHANQLYFEANDLYNRDFKPPVPLPPGTAERVIEQTFRVLTRTDGQRVVRNRVTGAQVVAMLSDAALPWPVVCRILRPFRAEGTTFLAPFLKAHEDDRAVLPPDAVLDISHESLIRNWGRLTEWAKLEDKDVRVASDLWQQASRWQENAESRGYLLPVGLYRFFAKWYAGKQGVESWLTHYQGGRATAAPGNEPAAAPNGLLARYLATSRRHLWSDLLAARYGVWRLTAALVLPVLLLVLGMWWWPQRQKQSDYVAGQLVEKSRTELATYAQQMKARARERAQARRLLAQGHARLPAAQSRKDSAAATQLIDHATRTLSQTAAVLPAEDMARFILNADRLKEAVHRPLLGPRTAGDYSFPRLLDLLQDDTLALDTELSMFALVNNLKYERVARANPAMQPILRDLVTRLDQAGDLAPAAPTAGRPGAAPSETQRRLAARTARAAMALAYYLAADAQVQASSRPDSAGHRAARQALAASQQALLRRLRRYVRAEVEAPAGPAPSPLAFGFCLRVLLGQGHDGRADLAFLSGLSPFEPGSRRQFERLFPAGLGLYAQTTEFAAKFTPRSGGYLTAAMAFAALGKPAQVLRCLDTLRVLRLARPASGRGNSYRDTAKTTSAMALVPYLLKYELLDAQSTPALLAGCARASRLPLPELYAAAAYSLLSVKPLPAVFDASQDAASQLSPAARQNLLGGAPARAGGISLEHLNLDRVSFSLPGRTRDKAWAALRGANAAMARRETLFAGRGGQVRPASGADTAHAARLNRLFLDAFWAKTHGIYLSEIAQSPQGAARAFAQFSQVLPDLRQALRNNATALLIQDETGTPQPGQEYGDLLTFLQSPLRPFRRTLEMQPYAVFYTCSFRSFFLDELQRQARPEWPLVQLLDNVAFAETWRPEPDPALVKALASTRIPGNAFRDQRNALLLQVAEAIRSRQQLNAGPLPPTVAPDALRAYRQLLRHNDAVMTRKEALLAGQAGATDYSGNSSSNEFYDSYHSLTIENALHQLALEMARGGNILNAFALTDSILATTVRSTMPAMNYAHKIRIGEQAMLTNSQRVQPALDNFLLEYLARAQAGVVAPDAEASGAILPAASVLAVCFWRPFAPQAQLDSIPLMALPLTYRLKKQSLPIGLNAPFKAYGLADDLYQARAEIDKSPFLLGFTKFTFANQALLGYAHLLDANQNSGWHEFDAEGLTLPAEYVDSGD